MATTKLAEKHPVDLNRLVTFIDGVYAVAITLLILDLKLPSGDLSKSLVTMLPNFLVYLTVFASIAGYWIIHHYTFRLIVKGDTRILLLSLLNLLFITLYPLNASIVGAHPLEPLATVCLSVNSLLYALSSWALWHYASSHPQLIGKAANQHPLRRQAGIMMVVAIGLTLAIPLAFISVFLAYAIWILCTPIAAWLSRRLR
jgi:uncharacterized membrane protein